MILLFMALHKRQRTRILEPGPRIAEILEQRNQLLRASLSDAFKFTYKHKFANLKYPFYINVRVVFVENHKHLGLTRSSF
jgi:hypothetical protein